MLTRVKGIGNDLALDEGVGICGKGGQIDPRRRRPADPADRRADGRRHGRLSDWRGDVLKFGSGSVRAMVAGDAELDEHPRRFLELWSASAAAGELRDARDRARRVILFDQFPRNMFRGHADQFATDQLALAIAGRGRRGSTS